MPSKNNELLKRLLATFRVEADEHLRALSSGLVDLGKVPAGERQSEIVERIFREAHSLKGAARAVNLTDIESVCQSLESVFAAVKGGQLAVARPLLDLLHQTVDALGGLLGASADASARRTSTVAVLTRQLDSALTRTEPASQPALPATTAKASAEPAVSVTIPAAPAELASDTVRVSVAKLDTVMRQVEELLAPRLAADQRTRELHEATAPLVAWRNERARIQPALRSIEREFTRSIKDSDSAWGREEIPKLLEYLEAEQFHMKTLEDRLAKLNRSARHDQRMLDGMTDSLLHDVKEMQLLPFASLLDILPRFARELARDQGKEVEIAIQGGAIEIDRRILEQIKDPLLHLLRNAIDHGIEQPAARAARRKPPHGTITLAITQKDSGKVEVLVEDDGAGINTSGLKAAAGKLGVVAPEEVERLSEHEMLALAFHSGVTTSPIITDVSGRGLGLAIVREKIERLGGMLALDSKPAEGTTFRILLPLTLANFRGILVRSGGQLFVIPAAGVERVTQLADADVRTVENRETLTLNGQAVALAWLSDVLELPHKEAAHDAPAIVLESGLVRIALRVDEVLGEQEVLVKPLGRQLPRVRNVAGASVLGTGQVVPVLNVHDLIKSSVKRAQAPRTPVSAGNPEVAEKRSILVVEDSITSRTLLKNILESADYQVTTAVDGVEAYAALKTGAFDLVVSDVEMPRMDGFDLTARVRADKQIAELPVVLVTALESREHRERGIDVGANAYIVKSSFDQNNLLEVIRRLI